MLYYRFCLDHCYRRHCPYQGALKLKRVSAAISILSSTLFVQYSGGMALGSSARFPGFLLTSNEVLPVRDFPGDGMMARIQLWSSGCLGNTLAIARFSRPLESL